MFVFSNCTLITLKVMGITYARNLVNGIMDSEGISLKRFGEVRGVAGHLKDKPFLKDIGARIA